MTASSNERLVLDELSALARIRLDALCATEGDFPRAFEQLWSMVSAGLDRGGMRPQTERLNRRLGGRFVSATIAGVRLLLDAGDGIARLGLLTRSWERQLAELLAPLVRPGDVAFDVGAHTGYYSLLFAARAGASGRVLAVDPSPDNCARCRRYVERNGFTGRVEVSQLALSDKAGRAEMFEYRHDDGEDLIYAEETGELLSLIPSGKTGEVRYEVEIDTLDHHAERNGVGALRLLKIDTEGAELQVLRGARRTLERSPAAVVVVELHPTVLREAGSSPDEVLRWLARAGLSCFDPRRGLAPLAAFSQLAGTTVLAARDRPS